MADLSRQPIRTALLANALFSAVSGIILLLAAPFLAAQFGLASPLSLRIIGAGLLIFVLSLLHAASRPLVSRRQVLSIIIQDALWVLASLIILIIRPFGLSSVGLWAVALVAMIVAGLAFWQSRVIPLRAKE